MTGPLFVDVAKLREGRSCTIPHVARRTGPVTTTLDEPKPVTPAGASAQDAEVWSMISPTESLAFSMHANPGVYAVLVGSGVSRAAKIPTGWEITLDLIRRLAALRQEAYDPDPERWYRNTFNQEADYSHLLNEICKTAPERQQLLRSYFEPSADERENGAKRPTAAHRAIAALAAEGFIRVILTTNFDRLIQTALGDVEDGGSRKF